MIQTEKLQHPTTTEMDIAEGKEQLLTKHLLMQVSQQCPQMSEEVSKFFEPSVQMTVFSISLHIFIKSTSQKQIFRGDELGIRAQNSMKSCQHRH